MSKPKTICAECHWLATGGYQRSMFWVCRKFVRKGKLSPITGTIVYEYPDYTEYGYCRDKNLRGRCRDFVKRTQK